MKKIRKVWMLSFCLVLIFTSMSAVHPTQQLQAASYYQSWDTYSDSWVATDELGRTVPAFEQVGPEKNNRFVGVHYLLWHHGAMYHDGSGDPGTPPHNVMNILTNQPGALNNPKDPAWGTKGDYEYWGKPIFDYYDLNYDEYVLRKQAQMLSDIGVDTLFIDQTNLYGGGASNETGYYNYNELMKLCQVFTDIRNSGGKTPQLTIFCTWSGEPSARAVTKFYNDIYSKNLYPDLWFKWEGKPLIIADKSAITDPNILNFFTFRKGQPTYTVPGESNSWPWLSIYPQNPAYTATNAAEEVAVGTAQNWSSGLTMFAAQDTSGNFIARGRSYHNGSEPLYNNPVSANYPSKYGYNFQEGLDRALEIDPNLMWASTWNEWIAIKFDVPLQAGIQSWVTDTHFPAGGAFCDAYTAEFSRDIEPTLEGGLGDNYYMQFAAAIRKYKGVRAPAGASGAKSITIDGSFSDWTDVKPEFRDDKGDKAYRNYAGIASPGSPVTYTNTTGRNDFKLMKVARDSAKLYFYVETVDNITSYTDPNWMRLLIKTNDTDPNWKGYNYILNRTGITGTTTTLEKSTGGWNWTSVDASVQYKISGNKMEIAVPRSDLGLNTANPVNIQFKWNDNMQTQGDIYDFYLNGDTAPNNRFNYRFTESPATASFTRNMYSSVGNQTAVQITSGNTPAVKFTADYSFNGVEAFCPSYSNNTGSLTMKLYKWNTDYNTTIAGTPIATQQFVNFNDNAWLKLNCTTQLPGEYLWLLNNPVETVGVWKYDGSGNTAVSYLNGSGTPGDYMSRIDYTFDPDSIPTIVNNNDVNITYSGLNYSSSSPGYINNDCHYTNIASSYGQYTFIGTGVSWIGSRNADHGYADVYIDGVLDATVDTYSSSNSLQQVLYQKNGLASGSHTIKIVVKNAKNPASGGYFQDIDAFVITNARFNDNDPNIAYSGLNYSSSSPGYINSDCHYSNTANSYAQYTFKGTGVSWIGSKNTDHGYADVYIDGVLDGTADTYLSSNSLQQVLYQKTGLAYGSHTIKIVVKNAKNSASSGYFQDIDAFIYH